MGSRGLSAVAPKARYARRRVQGRALAFLHPIALRRQVIGLRESGLTYKAIGQVVGLTRNRVFDICKRYRTQGMAGLQSGPRGPAPGTGRLLTPAQEAEIRQLICDDTPDGYGLPFALWSRRAVAMLIEQHCGVCLAVRTMGTYLARWNFTPQKPLRRAYEQDPDEVRHWLKKTYPTIQAKARRQKGRIFRGDETGLRSDDVRGRSYAPRGQTPIVRPSQKRANVGVILAVSNQGELRWMVLHGTITAATLIMFLQRLIHDAGCKHSRSSTVCGCIRLAS